MTWKLLRARIIEHTSGPLNAKGIDAAMEEQRQRSRGQKRGGLQLDPEVAALGEDANADTDADADGDADDRVGAGIEAPLPGGGASARHGSLVTGVRSTVEAPPTSSAAAARAMSRNQAPRRRRALVCCLLV